MIFFTGKIQGRLKVNSGVSIYIGTYIYFQNMNCFDLDLIHLIG